MRTINVQMFEMHGKQLKWFPTRLHIIIDTLPYLPSNIYTYKSKLYITVTIRVKWLKTVDYCSPLREVMI